MDNQVTQTGVEMEQRRSRRGVIAAGAGGAALSLLPFLGGRADAAATTTTEAATTTTAPPKRPTDDDVALLGAAQQVELATLTLYDQAIAQVKGWSAAESTVVTTLREAHNAFANSLSGLLGRKAPNSPDRTVLADRASKFTGGSADVLAAAADLESALVATHLEVLGKLQGVNGGALIASIVSSEARHVTVLRDLAGVTDLAALLVDTEADSLLGKG